MKSEHFAKTTRRRPERPERTERPAHDAMRAALATLTASLALSAAACSSATPSGDAASDRPVVQMEDCVLTGSQTGASVDARCGTVTVFEDREAGSGRQIDLNVAVLPSISRSPEPDPLFLLAGGPGQAATTTFPDILNAFERLNQDRDVVLFDQRGTGESLPLDCPALEEGTGPDDTAAIERWARQCAHSLSETADLTQYTTESAVGDLDDVRAALGYERVNLYGGSYGTRLALAYMRRHPDRVRTAILDSVVPPDLALGTTVARDAQHALDLFFERCEGDELCSAAFPRLRQDFRDVMDRLAEGPIEVEIADPHTGAPRTIQLTEQAVAGTMRFLSYAPETAALIPLLVHTAASQDDMRQLAAQVAILGGGLQGVIQMGLHFSVVCAEDVPFFDADDVRIYNADTYLADLLTDQLALVCGVWPHGDIPDDFKTPVRVDVPTLVLSGETDPVTPPTYGDSVAASLSDSVHVVAPGQGHGVIVRGCVPRLARSFVESGSTAGLDAACVQELAAPPFFISATGPEPEPEATETEAKP